MKDPIELRREFHRHPEPGWTEFRTTVRIIEELQTLGIPVRWGREIHDPGRMLGLPAAERLEGCWQRALEETGREDLLSPMRGGFTGCIAEIEGAAPGPLTVLRVDIDCCEVAESASGEHRPAREGFSSCYPNCMHACGHDAHAAIGLGAAAELWARREELAGTVRLIFQSAEEGLRGAASMTAAGAVAGADRLFGLHVGIVPGPVGRVAVSAKGFLSSTKLDAIFHGRSAHAGICPEEGRNALAAGARATLELLEIPQKVEKVCRVNVGTFHAGTGRNVIPDRAHLAIETRGETAQVNANAEEMARNVCAAAAEEYGCTVEFCLMGGAGGAACDDALARRAAAAAEQLEGVTEILYDVPFGGGEDVTTMMTAVQAQGGQATELVLCADHTAPHHNGSFEIDEGVIPLGVELLTRLALLAD